MWAELVVKMAGAAGAAEELARQTGSAWGG
jgi:hypothetical protein